LPNMLQIAGKQMDLKKKLKVTFAGEPGLDMGGLTKEWFLLLVRQIFQPEYGNSYCTQSQCLTPFTVCWEDLFFTLPQIRYFIVFSL